MDRKEAYRIAITAEVRSQALYRALAKSFTHEDTAAVFTGLVNIEEGHEAQVQAAYQAEYGDGPILVIDDYDPDLALLDLVDPLKVLEFAITREELARANYVQLALDSGDSELKEQFLHFATEESGHATVLLAMIQRLSGTMIWYDPSELSGLMED